MSILHFQVTPPCAKAFILPCRVAKGVLDMQYVSLRRTYHLRVAADSSCLPKIASRQGAKKDGYIFYSLFVCFIHLVTFSTLKAIVQLFGKYANRFLAGNNELFHIFLVNIRL